MTQLERRKLSERVAKISIFGAAGLTILILFFIIGFIVFRGFYSRNQKEYAVSSYQEQSFSGYRLVINKKIRISEIPFDAIAGVFGGDVIDWGRIAGQEEEILALAVEGTSPALLGLSEWGAFTELEATEDAVLQRCAAIPGAVALVSESAKLPSGVRPLSLRRLSIAVHPFVTRLVDNIILKSVTEENTKAIFRGEIQNWKELGGHSESVQLVLPPQDSELFLALVDCADINLEQLKKNGAMFSSSMDEYLSALSQTEGAVGPLWFDMLNTSSLSTIRISRIESGPNLDFRFLFERPRMSGKVGGISTIIVNTLVMILLTLLIATPIGVLAAVYLVEYAKQGRLVRILRLGSETLAGIPSIIFGLFGMLFFVNILGWGIGLISGVLTLTLMILPTIVRTSEEALKTVPVSLREGSLALGATRLQTTLKVVVPTAIPGILTGVLLALGRAVGETAALVFTMGSSYDLVSSLSSSSRVLAVHIYLVIAEGISLDKAFATATVLVGIILAINITASQLLGLFKKRSGL